MQVKLYIQINSISMKQQSTSYVAFLRLACTLTGDMFSSHEYSNKYEVMVIDWVILNKSSGGGMRIRLHANSKRHNPQSYKLRSQAGVVFINKTSK